MDGLTTHILQQLAFEGDLGSDISRLRQLISQYYSTLPSVSQKNQTIDDKFCGFVWGLLVTQDKVIVGLAPEGAAAVYFPLQGSKGKTAGKGKNQPPKNSSATASISSLPPSEVALQPLEVLVAKYGDELRIAVAPDICFVCITGSHIRPPKLSANAYAVLQLIARSRREGISVANISRQSGYDPKTCFYFVKILVSLGHIHKIKVGGSAVNICVHKAFYDDQCVWKQASNEQASGLELAAGSDVGEEGGVGDKELTGTLKFESIDNRHMSNPAVIKSRIERLLRHMPNGLHVYRHLLEAIGFSTSKKKERRVFTHRVHELLKSRYIEKVWAKSTTSSTGRVLCIRLVTDDLMAQELDVADEEAGDEFGDEDDRVDVEGGIPGEREEPKKYIPEANLEHLEGTCPTQTVAYQIVSMIEESDTMGMTISEISKRLHNFDIRSITNLTARFSTGQPPTHLAHRALVIVTEMFGRERRQRIYTLAAYRTMIEREGLEDQSNLESTCLGGWAVFEPGEFVSDEKHREEWVEEFVKNALVDGGEKIRERKGKKGWANPLGKDGVPIKGRPRKEWSQVPSITKKRGRPPKRKVEEMDGEAKGVQGTTAKKPRGTPAKINALTEGNCSTNDPSVLETPPSPTDRDLDCSTVVTTGEIPTSVQTSQPSQSVSRQTKNKNVSALRRQTEFLQLIENMGGVVNVSLLKNFNDEHQRLLQDLLAAGKAVSTAPGTGMDKRTFTSTISALEMRGLVKTLIVSTLATHGATRRAHIVHLADASADSIEECIEKFRQRGSTKGVPLSSDYPELPEAIAYGSNTKASGSKLVTSVPAPASSANAVSDSLSRARTDSQCDPGHASAKGPRLNGEEARHTLALKATQAKKDQDTRWELIVKNALDGTGPTYPQLQKALAPLKSSFAVAPHQVSNKTWEAKVKEMLQESIGAKQFVIPPPLASPGATTTPGPSREESGTPVSTLILQQGSPIRQKDIAPKKSGRKPKNQLLDASIAIAEQETRDAVHAGSDARRRRFPWNPEYDELARDSGAIIRVRCRSKRMDWSALEQVFPGVQRNSVRQRITSLENLPGAAEYYRRLDDAWATLWLQHRGTNALPDPNHDSVKDFDLPAHVTFLRQNINKSALHAGVETQNTDIKDNTPIITSINQLHEEYSVSETHTKYHPSNWDFCFDLASEEPREREFLQHPFVIHDDSSTSMQAISASISVAQAAIKMTMSTPEHSYDSSEASAILGHLGERTVELALEGMKDILALKKSKEDRSNPERKYMYSDSQTLRLKGDFANSMYLDALAMRDHLESLGNEEWRDVDLIDEDGEVAAYLQLLSDDKLIINVDTSVPALGRKQLGWQSKKVDDEHLEAHLAIRLKSDQENCVGYALPSAFRGSSHLKRGILHANNLSCAHTPGGIDCTECLRSAAEGVSTSAQLLVMDELRGTGHLGLTVSHISEHVFTEDKVVLSDALVALTNTTPPLVYSLGYDQARIVSATEVKEWTIAIATGSLHSEETKFKLLFPRRWLDIRGNIVESVWTAANRVVVGTLMYRPSMNEHEIRQRHRDLFDRQELNDILADLLACGRLKRTSRANLPVGMLGLEEEKETYWSLANGDIYSGHKDRFEAEFNAFHSTAALLLSKASSYGLPPTPQELNEEQQGILHDLSSGAFLRFQPPQPLSIGRLVFDLDASPGLAKTRANFISLCKGDKGMCKNAPTKPLHYKGTAIHRIVKDFVIQGGDITRNDGSGGESIYGGKFADAKEGLKAKPKRGSLVMANSGKNSNTSQFFVVLTTDSTKLSKIAGKHVVFGEARLVGGGGEILDRLATLAGGDEKPKDPVWIEECGVLLQDELSNAN